MDHSVRKFHLLGLRLQTCVLEKLPVLDSNSNEGSSTSYDPYAVLAPAQKFKIGKRATETGTATTIKYYAKRYSDIFLKE